MATLGTRARTLLTGLLLLTVSLAGCIGNETHGDGDGTGTPALHIPTDEDLEGQGPFSIFLCKDGYHVSDHVTRYLDTCNHRVTLALEDPSRSDPEGDRPDVRFQHGPANEVSIAVNPTDALNLAGGAKDYTVSYVSDVAQCGEFTVWMGTFASHDGGLTWSNDLMPGFPGDDRESPLAGNWCQTDPVLVFDDDGALWYSGLNYDGAREDTTTAPSPFSGHDLLTGSQLYFARSADGGESYPEVSFAAAGDDGAIFNDKQWFAVQPGGDHMIATWAQFGPLGNVIAYTESLDGGETWLGQKLLRPGVGSGLAGTGQSPAPVGVGLPANGQFSMPQYLPGASATDPAMDLAVIWWDGDGVLYAEGQLTPGGTEFGPIQSTFPVNSLSSEEGRDGTGPTEYRLSTYPVLAVDTSGGNCDGHRYVIWADQPGEVNTDTQVLLRSSVDGLSWSEPVTVNDQAQGDQFMPWVDVDPEGGVHAVWYDKRNDPENVETDVYYGYSADCGQTWTNVRVTETSSDGDLAHHQNGRPFLGDYISVDTTSESAHIIWSDTRHTGEPGREAGSDVYAATILRDLGARSMFDEAFEVTPPQAPTPQAPTGS